MPITLSTRKKPNSTGVRSNASWHTSRGQDSEGIARDSDFSIFAPHRGSGLGVPCRGRVPVQRRAHVVVLVRCAGAAGCGSPTASNPNGARNSSCCRSISERYEVSGLGLCLAFGVVRFVQDKANAHGYCNAIMQRRTSMNSTMLVRCERTGPRRPLRKKF